MNKKYWLRALAVFVATFAVQMMAYEKVPMSVDAFWQPFWVSLSGALTQAGINAATRGR